MNISETIEISPAAKQLKPLLAPHDKVEAPLDRMGELGQFLTPAPVAEFMASLFQSHWRAVNLLDAGAGVGALTTALVRRLCRENRKPKKLSVAAYEVDSILIEPLRANLDVCQRDCERAGITYSATVHNADFIEAVVPTLRGDLFTLPPERFNVAIVNPPYRKIRSDSQTRLLLRSAGVETSNLYAGFLALIFRLLRDRGEMVAITPRSFCNGPYFRPFREDLLTKMSLRRLHVFDSRSAAFSGDDVLQENIIVHAVKSVEKPVRVVISSSSGEPGTKVRERTVPFSEVVSADDPERFIHLVGDAGQAKARATMTSLSTRLEELDLSVSTGRVVDFRAAEFLRQQPSRDTVPLIYPCHFGGGFVCWPKSSGRKPNAIVADDRTRELLVPAEVYVLVKRFTSKEERRRVVACIYDPSRVAASAVGFENHLNYFHVKGHGLTMDLAKGLATFLNSTLVDIYFRQFNGHTQVNATDLRNLRYPTRAQLLHLGRSVEDPATNQSELDSLLERELHAAS